MKKFFLVITVLYLSSFLALQEEIHNFCHHFKEVYHQHTLNCFFSGSENNFGLKENCPIHDFYLKESTADFNFFSIKFPQVLGLSYSIPFFLKIEKGLSYNLPHSRGPPKFS